jgi:hypothetical protein
MVGAPSQSRRNARVGNLLMVAVFSMSASAYHKAKKTGRGLDGEMQSPLH